MNSRSSHRRNSVRKGVPKNFVKFTGKHLCQSIFLIKLKNRFWHRCFPVNFANFLGTPFFTEHLWVTGSRIYKIKCIETEVSNTKRLLLIRETLRKNILVHSFCTYKTPRRILRMRFFKGHANVLPFLKI